MKRRFLALIGSLVLSVVMPAASFAAFVSGSTGADGDFNPTTNIVPPIPESGIFNFGSINIPTGVTVTFTKNSANTPVTILATGDVTINGTISVNGSNATYAVGGAGGPGGYNGGIGGSVNQPGRRGEGPGGGGGASPYLNGNIASGGGGGGGFQWGGGGGASSNSAGGSGGGTYGNARAIPLLGGSGGGGAGGTNTYTAGGGGGGGGAILIASSGTITVNGSVTANGGAGSVGDTSYAGCGAGGSGGGIRLIANTIAGNGTISAAGGGGGACVYTNGGGGGGGWIRLEATTMQRTAGTNPAYISGYPSDPVPSNIPVLSISSIGGAPVPSGSKGSYSAPDIILPYNTQNPVTIGLAGSNIPVNTTVTVKATPSIGSVVSNTATLTGADSSATSGSTTLNISFAYPSIITASVTIQLAQAGIAPFYADGELVDRIRVATSAGGKSTITYITQSGKEVPAVM